jgi:hypothetical protein
VARHELFIASSCWRDHTAHHVGMIAARAAQATECSA